MGKMVNERSLQQRKTEITRNALMKRVNRVLAKKNEKLYKSRSYQERIDLGEYHIIDILKNMAIYLNVNLEKEAQETGALKPHEVLKED